MRIDKQPPEKYKHYNKGPREQFRAPGDLTNGAVCAFFFITHFKELPRIGGWSSLQEREFNNIANK